jgi:hypothetical protein
MASFSLVLLVNSLKPDYASSNQLIMLVGFVISGCGKCELALQGGFILRIEPFLRVHIHLHSFTWPRLHLA